MVNLLQFLKYYFDEEKVIFVWLLQQCLQYLVRGKKEDGIWTVQVS
jgi:hypothetical protein